MRLIELLEVDSDAEDAARLVPRSTSFRTTQAGELRFARQLSRVSVDAPLLDVIIGAGSEMEIIAPVSISAARLTLDCPGLVVLGGEQRAGRGDPTVTLEAVELRESKVERIPVLRDGATLQVNWPGAANFPWTAFQGGGATDQPDTDYALGRLSRLVLSFRSHSRGQLARYRGKIEHSRMMKGPGIAILQRLLQDRILSLSGEIYFLDPDRLGQIVGANYHDLKLKRFNQRVRDYVADIIRPQNIGRPA